MTCTRCHNTGFLNLHQVDENTLEEFNTKGDVKVIQKWMSENENHDVQVCDCCGNGEEWYGEPGYHYKGGGDDKPGNQGYYYYNGGLPECN